jgi:AraC family transcriptional regulator of adaptative response/methylated-DNA-[protein]-cysteine methyltransferase
MRYRTDEERWAAIQKRERRADGVFFYAVLSTGVYCRPTCAARRAKRENVRFFANWIEAEAAGFRACKRCRPNDSGFTSQRARAIEDACRKLAEQEKPNLDLIAAEAGMSRFYFQRVFKSMTGVTPHAYFAAQRRARIQRELANRKTVTQAIYDAGFQSNGRFYANSNELLGMRPKQFQKGGWRESIQYAVEKCSLGFVLVAATDKGICAILLGDDAEELLADLRRRFPKADLRAADAAFQQDVERVVAFVEQPAPSLDLPLDIRGTAFQQRVWEALQELRPGTTASYEEIASRIGAPCSVRAVAGACAANALAVAIPCHRVLRKNGGLGGYFWGLERKSKLLERERQSVGK